ncbi:sensor histidine kinase [Ferruginibacter sp.]
MKLIIKILWLFLPVFAKAQSDPSWGYVTLQQADSLRHAITTEKNDTVLMAAYRSLGFYYQDGKQDSSVYFHHLQLELAKKLGLKMWEADAYSQLGYMYEENVSKSYDMIREAIRLADNDKNETSNWHPWVFSNAKDLHDARIAIQAINSHALGNLYGAVNEVAKQRQAYYETIRLGKMINNGKIVSLGYGNLSDTYNNDSAILFTNEAINYSAEAGYKKYVGRRIMGLARLFFLKGAMPSVKQYAYAAIPASVAENDLFGIMQAYYALSFVYGSENQKDSALYYAKKSLQVSDLTQSMRDRVVVLRNMSNAYILFQNKDSAYKYEKLSNILNDSLKNLKIKQLSDYQKFAFNEQLRLKKINDDKTAAENTLKLYVAIGVLTVIGIVALILYKSNRQKNKTNKILESTLTDLKATQSQLIQSEKMASLGELTAGIAHEIQNPLNFVNNFSEVSNELIDELKEERSKPPTARDEGLENDILDDISQNLEKINHHGKRADAIVKGMLQHSRSSSGQKEPTDINALCDEYLRLAYHGLRAKDNSFNATLKTDFDASIGNINIVPQDMGRVILNLITNAFYSVGEKKKLTADSQQLSAIYEPTVSVSTKKVGSQVEIRIKDNGNGIPQNVIDKVFQPFFTTKPTGQGTGLGLSLAYDIIKAHGGQLKVETKEGEFAEFIITLPV